jgi:hypothetical protein
MKIRKQVYELKIEDIEKYPYWEFCLDEEGEEGQDEATVKPFIATSENDSPAGVFIIAAAFVLSNGTKYEGYVYAYETFSEKDQNNIPVTQPHIITDKGQIPFWFGIIKPKEKQIKDFYVNMKQISSKVFPISYKSKYAINSMNVSGILDGFYYYSHEIQGWFRLKQIIKCKK